MNARAASRRRVAAALMASSALAGCGHTETHAALLRAPQGPTGRNVELYVIEQAPPSRPFYDIAIVQAVGFGADATPEDVTHALTNKAAALGCDAVVRVYIDVGYTRAHAAGVCVKYLAPAPGSPETRETPVPSVLPPAPPSNPPPPPVRPSPAPRLEPLPSAPNQGR